jgi:hypothetical protein
MQIHFIEKQRLLTRADNSTQDWESGYWAVSKDLADSLIGGDIYLHTARDKPSYFGGQVTGYRIENEGPWEGRVVFQFTATMEHKGVKTGKTGWSMEKKLVK